jgi:L-amino acid N-acyltransferase
MSSTIRKAEIKDLDAILDIYNDAVLNSTATFDIVPRSKEQQMLWFSEHDNKFGVIVFELNDKITGWASLSRWNERPAYQNTAENSVYVNKDFRRRGIGRELLAGIVNLARENGFHTIIARIAEGNKTSVKMHSEVGFKTIGVMKEAGCKFGRWIDVTLMQKML